MGVPAENPFIPTDFELTDSEHAEQPWIHRFEFGELWLRQDVKFKQPKAAAKIAASLLWTRSSAIAPRPVVDQILPPKPAPEPMGIER